MAGFSSQSGKCQLLRGIDLPPVVSQRSMDIISRYLAAAEIFKIFCVFASLVRVFALDVFSRFLKS